MKLLKKISDKVLPTLFWLSVMLAFDSLSVCIITLISAAAHELGHIFAAFLVKRGDISLPRATFFGLKIDTGSLLSYKDEAIIASGGPIANLCVFIVSLPFFAISEYAIALGFINLFTAITNLLPMRGYDGERILRSALLKKWDVRIADCVSDALTLALSSSLSVISLVFIMVLGEGWWIFAFFFSILLGEVLKRH